MRNYQLRGLWPAARAVVSGAIALLALAAPAAAELVLTKSHVDENGGQLCVGDSVLFTIRVEAVGTRETFTLNDQIAARWYSSWSIVNTTGTNCSSAPGPLTPPANGRFCASGVTLNPGASFDFQFRAVVRDNSATPQICNFASARTANLEDYASNEDCVDYTCVPPGPNLFLIKQYTGPASPVVGDAISWRITLENRGTAADTAVRVTDTVDTVRINGATFGNFSRTPDSQVPGLNLDVTWNSVAAGETITLDMNGTYGNCTPGIQDGLCNEARVTSTTLAGISPGYRRSHPSPTAAEGPSCVIATPGGNPVLNDPAPKTVRDLGGTPRTLEYTVTFENGAPCPAGPGSFTDPLPAGLTLVGGSVSINPPASGTDASTGNTVQVNNLTVPAASAGPGTVTITFRATVTATSGRICNIGSYNISGSAQNTTEACFVVGTPDALTAAKTHSNPNGNDSLRRFQDLSYTIRLTNTGTTTLTDVRVLDTLPAGVSFVRIDQDGGGTRVQQGPTAVEISSISVPPGPAASVDIVFTVRENASQPVGGRVCNRATVTTTGNPSGPLTTNEACVTIAAAQANAIDATKSHNDPNGDGTLNRSQQLVYTIRLVNTGATPVTDVHVTDNLPTGVSFVSLDQNGGGNVIQAGPTVVEIDGITVNPGAASFVDLVFTVAENGSQPVGADICNQALVATAGNTGPVTVGPVCVGLREAPLCQTLPGRIIPLLAARSGIAAIESWVPEANSANGYRVYTVIDKVDIPRCQAPFGTQQCSSGSQGTTTCTDADAFNPAEPNLLFYQVVGICADGSEGEVN